MLLNEVLQTQEPREGDAVPGILEVSLTRENFQLIGILQHLKV